ncbi:MAG TPA: 50S ribosomal protein L6 [Clostridia bacterium]|nr:50S ribosomal protein L6 [Clostridia bacterium]
MSRIGRLPVIITEGVTVSVDNNVVTVKGKLGTLTQEIQNNNIDVNIVNGQVEVTRTNEQKETKAAHGLYRTLIYNMITGVTKGFEKTLVIAGVGYKAQMSGKDVILNVGYSHTVTVVAPEGITLSCPSITEVKVSGFNKELVGQTAANIKFIRKPEPYHGYGIHYSDETVLRKVGKKAGK